ncbi:Protein kinase domain [Trypanosoma vivax]|nr:Protein kinase domain [Trypanosoma vivax]
MIGHICDALHPKKGSGNNSSESEPPACGETCSTELVTQQMHERKLMWWPFSGYFLNFLYTITVASFVVHNNADDCNKATVSVLCLCALVCTTLSLASVWYTHWVAQTLHKDVDQLLIFASLLEVQSAERLPFDEPTFKGVSGEVEEHAFPSRHCHSQVALQKHDVASVVTFPGGRQSVPTSSAIQEVAQVSAPTETQVWRKAQDSFPDSAYVGNGSQFPDSKDADEDHETTIDCDMLMQRSPQEFSIEHTENDLIHREVTVVVVCLSDFIYLQEETVQKSAHVCRTVFTQVVNLAELHKGTVISVSSEKVVAVWNAFSPSPNHKKDGMQYACDALNAVERFMNEGVFAMNVRLTPVVVATSGNALIFPSNLVHDHETLKTVYGECMSLGEELPALLSALRIRCACTGSLWKYCPNGFSCIPRDSVTGSSGSNILVSEVCRGATLHYDKLVDAFKEFQRGGYDAARWLYEEVYEEDRNDWHALRMYQLCQYLHKSKTVYERRLPEWQLFPFELDQTGNEGWQGDRSYSWSRSEASPVEDHIRRIILNSTTQSGTPGVADVQRCAETVSWSPMQSWKPLAGGGTTPERLGVTVFFDRQGMMFSMSSRVIGTGACGTACMGLTQNGALVAIKQVSLPLMKHTERTSTSGISQRRLRRKQIHAEGDVEKILDRVTNEVSLLSQLRHANIVGYISSAVVGNKLLIVMELASGGNLYDIMKKIGGVKGNRAKLYLRDVLKGLEYLHRRNIVHRDIKPQNVLLLENGRCKLSDFGTSLSCKKSLTPVFQRVRHRTSLLRLHGEWLRRLLTYGASAS